MKTPIKKTILPALLACLAPATAAWAQSITSGPWSGNVDHDSATVCAAIDTSGVTVRVAASTSSDLSNAIYSPSVTTSSSGGNAARLELSGLAANTTYYYAIELNGTLQTTGDLKGTLKTHPAPGPRSFKFSFASCGHYNDSTKQFVYQAIKDENPLFYLTTGDLNYDNTNSSDPAAYRTTYNNLLTIGSQRNLVRHVPIVYTWDDHDFAGDNSNKNSTGRAAHRQVYRERVPHYPLPAGGPNASIEQTFTVGRAKFIVSDLRSERDPAGNTDNSSKTMMGATQKQWFKDELIAARDAKVPVIFWVSSVPLIAAASTSSDHWGAYTTERAELLNFIKDNNIPKIIVLAGDMHALALDDGSGTNSYVSGVSIPVFHAAALTRTGSTKGGPYTVNGSTTGNTSSGSGRYANVTVNDDGATLTVTYQGRIASGTDSTLSSVSTWKEHTVAINTPDGLVGRWKLDETSGTTAADSRPTGTANNGTLNGNAAWSSSGQYGGAIALDGYNDWIEIADSADHHGEKLSITAWVNSTSSDTNPRAIISKRTGNQNQQAFTAFTHTSNRLFVDIGNQRTDTGIVVGTGWKHIAVVFDGSLSTNRLKVYVNGASTPSYQGNPGTVTSVPDTTGKLHLGILHASYGYAWNGKIDDVRIYNRALTAEEVEDVKTANQPAAEINLASTHGTITYYSAQQTGNEAVKLIDGVAGDDNNRWSHSGYPAVAEIDLGATRTINSVILDTYQGRDYKFTIDAKLNSGDSWQTIVDASTNTDAGPITRTISGGAPGRYVRLTVTGASTYTGTWSTLRELKLIGTE